jgi:hypothetical protein
MAVMAFMARQKSIKGSLLPPLPWNPGYIQINPDVSGFRYIPDVSEYIPDVSGYILDVSRYIRIYPDISRMYLDISGYWQIDLPPSTT